MTSRYPKYVAPDGRVARRDWTVIPRIRWTDDVESYLNHDMIGSWTYVADGIACESVEDATMIKMKFARASD